MEQPNQPSLKTRVLSHIESTHTQMRPSWYFFVHAAVLAGLLMLVLGVLVFTASFTVFILRQNGAWFLPHFGWRGLPVLLSAVPWLVLLVAVVAFLVAEMLLRQYAFSYRRPLVVLVLGMLLFVAAGSALVVRVHAHERLERIVEARHVPLVGRVYRGPREKQFRDFHAGTIVRLHDAGFLLHPARGEELLVQVSTYTRMAPGMVLTVGDPVVVLGRRSGNTVVAKDILFARPVRW